MLGFLKRNIFNIVCGLVALGSIGLGVMGYGAMSKVTDEMQGIASIHGQFGSATKKPVNQDTIAAERRRVETIQTNFKAVIERAHALNRYQPLTPPEGESFFPEPTRDGRLEFPDIYRSQFDRLLERLKAGTPPNTAEIKAMQDLIEEEEAAKAWRGESEDEEAGTGRGGGRGDRDDNTAEEKEHRSGLITAAEAWESAGSRAAIQKARSLYCYASRYSFDENTRVYAGLSPRPSDMWMAQVALWIQQDVVDSIARINEAAAERLKAEGRRPWVGLLPVKDLISIQVSNYLELATRGTGLNVLGDKPSYPPGDSGVVFTQNSSTDLYELVQFSLKMVVDARDLPLIIDGICSDKFHTLLNIAYAYEREALESLRMEGKIYGSEPTVKVVMDFETIFFGDIYRRLMPETVLGRIGKERPVDEEEDDS